MAEAAAVEWSPNDPVLGVTNALLTARSRMHGVSEFAGPLSIKTVLEGRVPWKTGRREVWVDESCFLVLRAGEPYSMDFELDRPVTTSCVFFEDGFVEAVGCDLMEPVGKRLEDEGGRKTAPSFLSCLHTADGKLTARMRAAWNPAARDEAEMAREERFLDLAAELLLLYEEVRMQMGRIPATRAATRTELFLRVARGREFLHAACSGPVRLAEAARAACLSPFHFQRTFRRAFGTTPSQYVNELRMEKAARLLRRGSPVTETCFDVGFHSVGSFSASFRRRYGISPSRLLHGNSQDSRSSQAGFAGTNNA